MKDQDGFTLIELMVVVLIIAILIAIAIPTFLGLRERAQNRAATSDVRNALTAAKAFYTDGDTYTPASGDFNAADGTAIEPSLTWVDGVGSETQVGVQAVTASTVMLTKQSASEDWFCAVDEGGSSSVYGPGVDAPADIAACKAFGKV
jgi:type IV pilus assembly protein PilA